MRPPARRRSSSDAHRRTRAAVPGPQFRPWGSFHRRSLRFIFIRPVNSSTSQSGGARSISVSAPSSTDILEFREEEEWLYASDLAHSVDACFPRLERKVLNLLSGLHRVVGEDELGALPAVGLWDFDGGGLSREVGEDEQL